jgi:hypothetical protein
VQPEDVPEVRRDHDTSVAEKEGIATMKKRNWMLVPAGVLAAMLLIASQAGAQMGPGMGFGRGYYAAPSETIHGVVETVQTNADFCRWGGTEVALKTENGTVNVILGPAGFLSQNNVSIAKGDELSVTGFNLASQRTPYLIAREVSKGDKTLTLRNAQGFPAWAGRGMGRSAYGRWHRGCGGPGCGRGGRWW